MEANETNINNLQDRLWYVIRSEEIQQGVQNTQNINTNSTNDFVRNFFNF
jgi:hypothetical protein